MISISQDQPSDAGHLVGAQHQRCTLAIANPSSSGHAFVHARLLDVLVPVVLPFVL